MELPSRFNERQRVIGLSGRSWGTHLIVQGRRQLDVHRRQFWEGAGCWELDSPRSAGLIAFFVEFASYVAGCVGRGRSSGETGRNQRASRNAALRPAIIPGTPNTHQRRRQRLRCSGCTAVANHHVASRSSPRVRRRDLWRDRVHRLQGGGGVPGRRAPGDSQVRLHGIDTPAVPAVAKCAPGSAPDPASRCFQAHRSRRQVRGAAQGAAGGAG